MIADYYQMLTDSHPKISRGNVWCTVCGRETTVDPVQCFRQGWPKCCSLTMTIDSPEERAKLKADT